MTGFYREGFCRTGPEDRGLHTICFHVTQPFLKFLADQGNDLITPRPEYDFPRLTNSGHADAEVTLGFAGLDHIGITKTAAGNKLVGIYRRPLGWRQAEVRGG